MITQRIRPDNGSREGKWIALTIAAILAASALLLPYHQAETDHAQAQEYQVLITDLEQQELAMIADLKLAHEEIRDLHSDTGEWPEISELESYWIAPFVKDQSWKRKGSHTWQRIEAGIYLGIKQDEKGSASMILDSRNKQADIWRSQQPMIAQGLTLIEPEERQQQGWKQIVLISPSSNKSHPH